MNYKNKIAELIKTQVELEIEDIKNLIEIPPKSEMGDYAFPCFQLSKVMKKAPNVIAKELKDLILPEGFEKIENLGPYLNFFVNKGILAENIISKVLNEGDEFGASDAGKGKTVCVEYSSPNIAKPFHVGHLSTTVIGNSLYKMFKKEGYNVVGINHLGDWGTQFGKQISAYDRWVDEEALNKNPIDELLRIYVKFHEEAEKDTTLEEEARANFKALENGDEKAITLWNKFRELSLKEFERIYDILGIKFDSLAGEAFYNDKMDIPVKELKKKGLLVESNGAQVVMLEEYNMPPCIVLKGDGASIYATRDLAAAIYRKKTYDFYKCIYVVGNPQALHFKQVFKVLELAGHEWAKDCVHVGFGLVKFADRKLSTRNGSVILLDDLLREAVTKTIEIINEKNPNLNNKEEAAKKIGVGAVKFMYLKNSRDKDIVFDWKEILSFDGETGPYVQYSYARGNSILNKGNKCTETPSYSKLCSKEEFELVKLIAGFNDVIVLALDKLEPSILTRYIVEVSKTFNKFYNAHSVLNLEDEKLKAARLNLVKATLQVIKNGLDLLGIDIVEEM
ncbi:Arginyl-tRNA synthetase [Clostridium sp. DL-VIII]|uniref:arginine--tRNA ligase n=1 Tax=Clostridium sp. DL-VIII TaxID=641107 RepID=UPI00023AF25A|nr:arginine--tRNA ligase [Clostridium sp. DL-VIII]EHI98253.1 Arginyl-tRNA synthetase [Clostridium sp. DL-VIII]